jgi:hypothetical protein
MLIDQVKDVKFDNKKAKLLSFTNTHLTEASIGGIYGLIDEGYTYTIEFYGEDNPEANALIKEILKSIKITKPLTEPNIVILEDDFTPTDWYESEAMKEEAAKAKAEAEKAELEKKNKKGFFKRAFSIFKKKNKKAAASSN